MAQSTHYSVKLVADFERQLLRGDETIEFQADAGVVEWQKQAGLRVVSADVTDGEVTVAEQAVRVRLPSGGRHSLKLKYTAAAGRGIKWFAGNAGLATAFYCEAWMVCDNSPGQRATLQLKIAIPFSPLTHGGSGFRVVGPGRQGKEWRGRDGDHFVFEQSDPVQTYLFSFGVARLAVAIDGMFSIYAQNMDANKAAFAKTADAYAFLRAAASVDPMNAHYTQVFLPGPSMGQEAAGIALMSQNDLNDLTGKDDVQLVAHELAHQWWGVTLGIRSWSDFWLNEGFAELMSDAYIEKHQGRAAYDQQIAELQDRMKKLREEGKDRPLHWEKWKDAHEALGQIPYVKGALFLARLRTELGDEIFWRGIGLYTSGSVRRLVDSGDFERAMEKASGRDLKALFDEAVYH
ncbi:MAG TPA: M1 family aminopeptidase [Candidatus Acidoferrum sp.]|nr:M1 family aminopeptidase [Candidatus Acidoferrum sp.]